MVVAEMSVKLTDKSIKKNYLIMPRAQTEFRFGYTKSISLV